MKFYREFEKGNNVIFRDYSQPIYVLHIENREKIFSNIQEPRKYAFQVSLLNKTILTCAITAHCRAFILAPELAES